MIGSKWFVFLPFFRVARRDLSACSSRWCFFAKKQCEWCPIFASNSVECLDDHPRRSRIWLHHWPQTGPLLLGRVEEGQRGWKRGAMGDQFIYQLFCFGAPTSYEWFSFNFVEHENMVLTSIFQENPKSDLISTVFGDRFTESTWKNNVWIQSQVWYSPVFSNQI